MNDWLINIHFKEPIHDQLLQGRMDFNRDTGIILFVVGKGKWIKIMCDCPSYSAWFVQQSPHMGTIERMGKYSNLVKSKSWSGIVEILLITAKWLYSELAKVCIAYSSGRIMHLFIWILYYAYNLSLLPYHNISHRGWDIFFLTKNFYTY